MTSDSGNLSDLFEVRRQGPRRDDLLVPDRFEVLTEESFDLRPIVVPVHEALRAVDERFREIRVSRRGGMMILRGQSGAGKSTFLDTLGLFVNGVTVIGIHSSEDLTDALHDLPRPDDMRVVIVEGREAMGEVSPETLEASVRDINSFVRSPAGTRALVVWPVNTDSLAESLALYASRLGGSALLGTQDPIVRFLGPNRQHFVGIVERTVAALNEGASLADLGVSDQRARQLVREAATIGDYLGLIRDDLIANGRYIEGLLARDHCRMWTVLASGANAEAEVAALTRSGFCYADVDRLLTATDANIAKQLRPHAARVGLLASTLDARIISLDPVTAVAVAHQYGDERLHTLMRAQGLTVKAASGALERFEASDLGIIVGGEPLGVHRSGPAPSGSTGAAFDKLVRITRTNDSALNSSIGRALVATGHVRSCEPESGFGRRINLRSDLLCHLDGDPIRIEFMWRTKAHRGNIAEYVLRKLRSYGSAIGLFDV